MTDRLYEQVVAKSALEPQQLDSDSADTDFNAIPIGGWDGVLLIANVEDINDSDTSLSVTLQAAGGTTSSDLVAGAISSDTFSWDMSFADAAEDEVFLADVKFSEVGISGSDTHIRLSHTALNASDTVDVGIVAILYGGTGKRPQAQSNTVTSSE